jgi:RNA polymerase sigma-70 factor (ECF subfamily)
MISMALSLPRVAASDSADRTTSMDTDEGRAHDEVMHLRSDVGRAMAEIGPRDRQMLWLAYVEGASHDEIARIMKLRSASVRSMLFRARKRLAEVLRSRGLRPGMEGS